LPWCQIGSVPSGFVLALLLHVDSAPNQQVYQICSTGVRRLGTGWVKVRLKRINSRQSIESWSDRIPFPFIRRAQSITSAAPTSTFFGSHPRRAQVPPNGLESTIATCHLAARQRDATADAPAPVPVATRSNCLAIFLSLEVRFDRSEPNYLFENLDILIGLWDAQIAAKSSGHLKSSYFIQLRGNNLHLTSSRVKAHA
jgi:hypothetical protein